MKCSRCKKQSFDKKHCYECREIINQHVKDKFIKQRQTGLCTALGCTKSKFNGNQLCDRHGELHRKAALKYYRNLRVNKRSMNRCMSVLCRNTTLNGKSKCEFDLWLDRMKCKELDKIKPE